MKLLYSFLKDLKLAAKGWYFYLEIGFALIFVAVLLFVVPEKQERAVSIYAHLDLEGPYLATAESSLEQDGFEFSLLDSREAVEAALEDDRGSVGLEVSIDGQQLVYDYILQGYESEQFRNVLKSTIEAGFAEQMPGFVDSASVITLEEDSEKLPLRLNILPVFLALNAAFMGLFIIASYIFLDKDEGTIRAFAVTPAHVWQYLAGKMGVMLVAGLVSGLLATVFVAGAKPHYLHLIVLLIACNLFGSALGLFISSFFNTMVKAMGWLYLSIIVLAFASVSYYLPAFSPLVIRILPSYPMLFAFRETLLDAGDMGYVYWNVLGFTAAALVFFGLSNWRFKKTLTI